MPATDETPLPHPTNRNAAWSIIQFVLRLVFLFWLRYQVRGLDRMPREGGGLVLVNHQSFLDPLLVGAALQRPVSYLARDSLFPIPFIGSVLRATYVMPISREAASTASIRNALKRLEHGFLVGIFPEGTRCVAGEVGEFRPGFISMIRRNKLPVYPVGIAGAHEAMPRRGLLRLCPRAVRVVYGEAIPNDQLRELTRKGREHELIAFVRAAVVACHEEAEAWRQSAI